MQGLRNGREGVSKEVIKVTHFTSKTTMGRTFVVVAVGALILSAALLGAVQTSALAKDAISVVVDGQTITGPGRPVPYVIQGETFMSIAQLVNALGGSIRWDGNVANVESRGHDLTVYPDSATWTLDGVSTGLPRMTFMHHDALYVPLAPVVQSLGCRFRYDPNARTAFIDTAPQ